jgi:hypothetical protein
MEENVANTKKRKQTKPNTQKECKKSIVGLGRGVFVEAILKSANGHGW